MSKQRRMMTSFSKGELSPLVESRPDLAAHFEGCSELVNWLLLRQGGVTRRPGLRFVREVKRSDRDTVLLPFEYSVEDAVIIEMGAGYDRFYKNRANLLAFSGGPPVEVTNPYIEAELRQVHITQSADVLWKFHVNHQQRRLSRISDTNWALNPIIYKPPPSFETDTDISGGATLTPSAVTGTNILFAASSAVFLEGDVGRIIVSGASRAIIVSFGASAADTASPNANVRADILDDFPDITPPLGPDILTTWKLRLSPQATLDPDKKEPIGSQVTLVAGKPSFRAADINKFVVIYGGLVKITIFNSVTQVRGELLSVMSVTDANPAASPAGAWTLEEASWSGIHGFPRTGEFSQGRLVQAATISQPVNFWMSAPDDFDNYAVGTQADNAIDYPFVSRKVNRFEWISDHDSVFFGTGGAEFKAESGKTGEPFGGDIIPILRKASSEGCSPVQPIVIQKRLVFLDRSFKKVFVVSFSLEEDTFKAVEITGISEHIMGSGVRMGPLAYTTRPDPRIYFVRKDGQLVALTFYVDEKVVGFTRLVTDGLFRAVAVIPQPGGAPDQVWVIVERLINNQIKQYVEFFEVEATDTVAGPGVFLESTGNGQAWFKGAQNALFVNTAVPVWISDTTVFLFRRDLSGVGVTDLRYQTSTDGGVTFAGDQAVSPDGASDVINDVLAVEIVVDPADNLPERRVFIVLANDSIKSVWVSRNVLQPNPALATWAKVDLPGGAPIGMGARGAQVCVFSQDGGVQLRLYNSNDFGVTFPNVTTFVESVASIGRSRPLVASPGVNIWVVLNPNNGSIRRTINNGVSWTLVTSLTGSGTAFRGCIINLNDTIMIAIYRATIWRSTDAGVSWVQVADGAAAGWNIVTMGYNGNGIVSGIGDATFDGPSPGSVEIRSEDFGVSWNTAPVDAGVDLGTTRFISSMAVRGARAIVVGSRFDGGGVSHHWYNPSTLVQVGPGESIKFADRPWTSLQTDSARVQVTATPTGVVSELSHLEGKTVDVVADGAYRGTKIVSMGSISMAPDVYSRYEVGLHYDSRGVTMRPAIEGLVVEGLPRSWDSLFARLHKTVGGKINGRAIQYVGSQLGNLQPFTGDRKVTGGAWDKDGRIMFEQLEPYPMTVLGLYGTISFGDHD